MSEGVFYGIEFFGASYKGSNQHAGWQKTGESMRYRAVLSRKSLAGHRRARNEGLASKEKRAVYRFETNRQGGLGRRTGQYRTADSPGRGAAGRGVLPAWKTYVPWRADQSEF